MTKDRLNILSVLFLVVLFCSTVYASPVITVDSAFTTSAEAVANMTGCDNQFPVVNTFSWNAPVTFFVRYSGGVKGAIFDVNWYSNGDLVFSDTHEIQNASGCFWTQRTHISQMPGTGQIIASYNEEQLFVLDFSVTSSCAAERLALADEKGLNVLRGFRDDVLSQSEIGREIIETYYCNTDRIVEVLEESLVLKGIAAALIDLFICYLED